MNMRIRKQCDELLARRNVASVWLETLKSGDQRNLLAFDQWLRESKLNIESYLEMEALDRQIQALDPADGPDIEALAAGSRSPVLWLERSGLTKNTASRSRRRGRWSLAAAVACIALTGALAFIGYHEFLAPVRTSASTAIGEERSLTLSDGSIVRMNADTALNVYYDERRRKVDLISGEAVFSVTPDALRPFVVSTGPASVRALGTEFNVYHRRTTIVSVLKGLVQITTHPRGSGQSPAAAQDLTVGEEAQIAEGRIEVRTHVDVDRMAAWREGQLYADAMPLEDIVSEFNRHGGPVRITLEDIAPGTYRFGGVFNVKDATSLADVLEEQDDLIVERLPGQIAIRPKPADVQPQAARVR